jgi:molybdopterin/thiamine biosynthesis adenylyltransferase
MTFNTHRYARHIALPSVGEAGQTKLLASKILVVGAGGLGSPALLYLAAAGIGHLGVMDADRVSLSNLQRQILYAEADVGREKIRATADRLHEINSDIQLTLTPENLTAENALSACAGYDVILDCSDNFATRYAINDACLTLGIPWVFAAIGHFSGYLSVFTPNSACYRCFHPEGQEEDAIRCDQMGVLGPLPGILGAMQAMEAIKLLLGIGTPLMGTLWRYDALSANVRHSVIMQDTNCRCSAKRALRG